MPPKKKRGLPPGALHHVERKHFKVLFCGKEFPAGAEETRKALEKHDAVGNCEFRFVACAREQVATGVARAHDSTPSEIVPRVTSPQSGFGKRGTHERLPLRDLKVT